MQSVSNLYSVDDRIINEYAAVYKIRIRKGNLEETFSMPLCPPQILHDLN
jgi:hypothetical protein